jgi:hypothetical protein
MKMVHLRSYDSLTSRLAAAKACIGLALVLGAPWVFIPATLTPLSTVQAQSLPSLEPLNTPSAQLVERAKTLLGIPYRFGGNNPDHGFDCSGLVRFVFRDILGVHLPGRSEDIGQQGERLVDESLVPGDLVFFNTLNRPLSHVGIYIGNRQFLHAPSSGGVVRVESMSLPYWSKRYEGARRMISQVLQASTLTGILPSFAHGAEVLEGKAESRSTAGPVGGTANSEQVGEKDPYGAVETARGGSSLSTKASPRPTNRNRPSSENLDSLIRGLSEKP